MFTSEVSEAKRLWINGSSCIALTSVCIEWTLKMCIKSTTGELY